MTDSMCLACVHIGHITRTSCEIRLSDPREIIQTQEEAMSQVYFEIKSKYKITKDSIHSQPTSILKQLSAIHLNEYKKCQLRETSNQIVDGSS